MNKIFFKTLIAISVWVCATILFCANAGENELFYYSTTGKVILTESNNKIIVKFSPQLGIENILKKLRQFGKPEKVSEQVFILTLKDTKMFDTLKILKADNDVISVNPIYLTVDKQEMGVTDEICLKFKDKITNGIKIEILSKFKAFDVSRTKPREQYFSIITVGKDQNALEVANKIKESGLVKFAHPNFIAKTYLHSFFPNDEFFPNQFYLHNTGQPTNDGHSGTADADIDAPDAWDITRGVNTITIAVIDEGVELSNNDLPAARLTVLPGSNFAAGDPNNPDAADDGAHGTCCAGIIAAEQNNTQGISGIAPLCRIMPVRVPFGYVPVSTYASAINFAWAQGADVLSNSWGFNGSADIPVITDAINNAITLGRDGTGSVVVWSAGNTADHAGGNPGYVSYPGNVAVANVITVGASDRNDKQANYSPTGSAVDVVAPSHRAYSSQITGECFEVWSTDITGDAGYNNAKGSDGGGLPLAGEYLPGAGTNYKDYTGRMGGTSAACPEVAGVAALILSTQPTFTPAQVFTIITNSADKIGGYPYANGRCNEVGNGRLNAFEAVRIAASTTSGGKNSADVFFCDNRLDWGNTEQPSYVVLDSPRGFIEWWFSKDIKVDAPPYQAVPSTSIAFDSLIDETPSAITGDINRVYVRVRNRGSNTATPVTVKVLWTQFGTALPALPPDFWTQFPNDSLIPNDWTPMNCAGSSSTTCTILNLNNSGSSVAGTTNDAAQIVQFDFPAPEVDPGKPNHFCLAAMTDTPTDRILPKSRPTIPNDFIIDNLNPRDNNVCHHNYFNLPTSTKSSLNSFWVRNPYNTKIDIVLKGNTPRGWEVSLDNFDFNETRTLQPNEKILVKVSTKLPNLKKSGELTITQERVDVTPPVVMGGITLGFNADEKIPSTDHKWWASIHGGITFPITDFGNHYKSSYMFAVDWSYHFNPRFSAVALIGFNHFKAKPTFPTYTNTYWWNLSANLKWEFSINPLRPYINGGMGAYIPKNGSTRFGYNLGLGIDRTLTSTLVFELGANYHHILTSLNDPEFYTIHAGLIFNL